MIHGHFRHLTSTHREGGVWGPGTGDETYHSSNSALKVIVIVMSLLSVLSEMHVRNLLIIDHLQKHYPLRAHQWGFTHPETQGKSTTRALVDATDQWYRQLDLGLWISAVCSLIMYSMALIHRPLLQKLNPDKPPYK